MKKKVFFGVLGILGVVLLALALWFVPAVEEIDRVMPAVEWSDKDETFSLPTEIAIKGKYYRYLFRDDHFIGTVSLPDYRLEPLMNTNSATGKPRYTTWNETVRIIPDMGGTPFTVMALERVGPIDPSPSFNAATGTVGTPPYRHSGCLRAEDGRGILQLVVEPGLVRILAFVTVPDSKFHYLSAPASTRDEAVMVRDALLPLE